MTGPGQERSRTRTRTRGPGPRTSRTTLAEHKRGDFEDLRDFNLGRVGLLDNLSRCYQYWIALTGCGTTATSANWRTVVARRRRSTMSERGNAVEALDTTAGRDPTSWRTCRAAAPGPDKRPRPPQQDRPPPALPRCGASHGRSAARQRGPAGGGSDEAGCPCGRGGRGCLAGLGGGPRPRRRWPTGQRGSGPRQLRRAAVGQPA
jgi:hypothetical protein